MWQENPVEISAQLLMLGTQYIPVYLVKGERYALLEGGMKIIEPVVSAQLAAHQVDPDRLDVLAILHTHHDHTGLVQCLQRTYPNLQVAASAAGARNLAIPELIASIDRVNDEAIENFGLVGELGDCEARIEAIPVDLTWDDGDSYDLGGLTLRTMNAPGHTDDGIAIHIPEIEALFISDTGGFKLSDSEVLPTPFSDIRANVETLERLWAVKPKILALGHFGIATNDEVDTFFELALDAIHAFTGEVRDRVSGPQDLEPLVDELVRRRDHPRARMIPEEVLRASILSMATSVLERG